MSLYTMRHSSLYGRLFRKPQRRGKTNLMEQLKAQGIDLKEYTEPSACDFEEDFYDRKNYAFTNKGERHYEGFSEADSYLISYEGDETHVVIREGITVIGNTAFAKKRGILSVHLPETLKVIEAEAFRECEKLEEINMPEGVEIIGEGAFKGCWDLQEIEIPPHIKTIGKYAFMGCAGIFKVEIPESIEDLGVAAFVGCECLHRARLPESLRVIPDFLFYGCGALSDVKISSETTHIGAGCFDSCAWLGRIDIPEDAAFGVGAFHGCYELVDENGMFIHGKNLLYCRGYVSDLEIPEGIEVVDSRAFEWCTDLNHLSFPDSVTKITGDCGRLYTGFSKIKAGDIVSRYPFIFEANDLEEVILSEKTTGIADGAFAMNDIEEIVIPAGVKFIGSKAFAYCDKLKKVVFKGDVPEIGKDAFEYVNAVMYYPKDDPAWSRKVFGSYGGCLAWKPYKPERS